jgi:hypothetical protein
LSSVTEAPRPPFAPEKPSPPLPPVAEAEAWVSPVLSA